MGKSLNGKELGNRIYRKKRWIISDPLYITYAVLGNGKV